MSESIEKLPVEPHNYNLVNLKRMALYVSTLKQEQFDMEIFRHGQEIFQTCDSVGCVIGHCTILDKPENITRDENGRIKFWEWVHNFTGIDENSDEWRWCFDSDWRYIDNTPKGASQRILYFIEHLKVPENMGDMLVGNAPVCYNHIEIRPKKL